MIRQTSKPADIIFAEDDDEDYFLIEDACRESAVSHRTFRVKDGEQLLKGLQDPEKVFGSVIEPTVVFLDLNMPGMDGIQALKEIKSHPNLCHIPIVILTTSRAEEEVARAYQLGVNSFLQKPISFEGLVRQLHISLEYWTEIVESPRKFN
ncbi:hypothetical protein UR09_02100 [Candidatus Nitromaritima sp. SCGC AAA799-A02]|nr:hypothetical protein UZ36_04630 [Candidatus Nitromaritima sp. SCGC AAA799-C22]KMP12002.1 hypothetical protein UR09_02100 [Candidatus Nitromaritima sp. SCGC AAA799-A02]